MVEGGGNYLPRQFAAKDAPSLLSSRLSTEVPLAAESSAAVLYITRDTNSSLFFRFILDQYLNIDSV